MDNVRTMHDVVTVGERAWHHKDLNFDKTTEQSVIAAALAALFSYTVDAKLAAFQDHNGTWQPLVDDKGQPNRFQLTRTLVEQTPEGNVTITLPFGQISDRYSLVQPNVAFDWALPLVNEGLATFNSAGILGGGQHQYIQLDAGEFWVGKEDDRIKKLITIINSYTGNCGIQCGYNGQRIVCANTMRMAQSKSNLAGMLSIAHRGGSKNIQISLDQARDAMRAVDADYNTWQQRLNTYASTSITDEIARAYFEYVSGEAAKAKAAAKARALKPSKKVRQAKDVKVILPSVDEVMLDLKLGTSVAPEVIDAILEATEKKNQALYGTNDPEKIAESVIEAACDDMSRIVRGMYESYQKDGGGTLWRAYNGATGVVSHGVNKTSEDAARQSILLGGKRQMLDKAEKGAELIMQGLDPNTGASWL